MQITRAVQTGALIRPVPGVVADPALATTTEGRIAIARAWIPDGILMGRAAARVWWGSEIRCEEIEVIGGWNHSRNGLTCRRRNLPPDLVSSRAGVQLTSAALTVLDCLRLGDRELLHVALRTRRVTLELLHQTLRQQPNRPGNAQIAAELWRARENPWSGGEDKFHEFLRERGFRRWKGNKRIDTPDGVFYGDVVFERERLIIEIDGFEHHSSPADLERDAERQAALLAAGYRVLRVTMRMLIANPDRLERLIREALHWRQQRSHVAAA